MEEKNQGNVFYGKKAYAQAIEAYLAGIAKFILYSNRCLVQLDLLLYAKADPGNVKALPRRGKAQRRKLQQYDSAAEDMLAAQALGPSGRGRRA